jgi:hypothetical protein
MESYGICISDIFLVHALLLLSLEVASEWSERIKTFFRSVSSWEQMMIGASLHIAHEMKHVRNARDRKFLPLNSLYALSCAKGVVMRFGCTRRTARKIHAYPDRSILDLQTVFSIA